MKNDAVPSFSDTQRQEASAVLAARARPTNPKEVGKSPLFV